MEIKNICVANVMLGLQEKGNLNKHIDSIHNNSHSTCVIQSFIKIKYLTHIKSIHDSFSDTL